MWVIVKFIKNKDGKELPVIILDSQEEILEFENDEDAQKQKNLIFLSSLLLIILGFTFTTFYKTINFWILIGLLLKQNSYHIQR
jgi:hypothetical protein